MDGRQAAPGAPDSEHLRRAALVVLESLENGRISTCPHCRESAVLRWGRGRSEMQRWRCRACRRAFSATTGTLLAGVHAPDKLRLVLLDMVSGQPSSCRRLAAVLALSAMTIWNWRQRVTRAFTLLTATAADEAPAAATATTLMRESRKASREWVAHRRDPARHPQPKRLRWVDYRERRLPLPRPMTPFLLAVRLVGDGHGRWRASLLPPHIARAQGASRFSDAPATSATTLRPPAAVHRASFCEASKAAPGEELIDRLRAFLRPFCGPASRHLGGYAAWFVAWQAATTEIEQRALAEQAWRVLTALRPTRLWTCASPPD